MDPKSRKQIEAVVAITLLEHAMGLLSAVTREAPRLDLGPEVAKLNRQIQAIQGRLLPISDPPLVIRAPRTPERET